jgi:hypothetical protein
VYNGMTINQLIIYANGLLAANPLTVSSSAARTEQNIIKNVFDAINNSFEQGQPSYYQPTAALCAPITF